MTQVLVVDDEPSVRLLLRDVLEMEGYDVREAPDGRVALELLDAFRPDCVVLDVMMPGMSGIEVLTAMRANPALAGLPVLMLTAANDDATTWSGWAKGANYYLAKPFDIPELLRWVGALSVTPLSEWAAHDLDTEPDFEPHPVPSPGPSWQLSAEHAELFRSALGDEPRAEPVAGSWAAPADSWAAPAAAVAPIAAAAPAAAVTATAGQPTGSWLPDATEPLAEELRRALRTEQVWVAYQPIVAIDDRAVIGVEAFARWRHPQRGDLAPSEFLPLAERSGLGDDLGRVILSAATRQVSVWNERRERAGLPPLLLTVNVSGAQFARGQFLLELPELLRGAGLAESLLVLEVSESTLVALDPETLATVLVNSVGGWRFSLDDSGAAEVSANLLRRFPVAFVKVDRSYVRGIGLNSDDDAAVTEIVAVAKRLGRSAVAEGVETRAQADWLQQAGCQFGQGFYFAHPSPAAHLDEFVLAGARQEPAAPERSSSAAETARLDRLDRALPAAPGGSAPALPGVWAN